MHTTLLTAAFMALFTLSLPGHGQADGQAQAIGGDASLSQGTGGYISDAFGLVPQDAYLGTPREHWAGHRVLLPETGADKPLIRHYQAAEAQPEVMMAFVGPKTARAGVEAVQATALALDRFGNLVPDGLTASVHPGFGEPQDVTTQGGRADLLFYPPPITGTYRTGISVAGQQAPKASYQVVTDLESIELSLTPQDTPIAQETAKALTTRPIHDFYGNPVEEGIALALTLEHEDGSLSRLNGITSRTSGSFRLLARGLTEGIDARLSLGPRRAPSRQLDYRPLVVDQAPKLDWAYLPSIDAMQLRIGPVMTDANFLLSDGSPVSVMLTLADGTQRKANGWLDKGHFTTLITAGPDMLPAKVSLRTASAHFERQLTQADQRQTLGDHR